jgi:hypothetical protein
VLIVIADIAGSQNYDLFIAVCFQHQVLVYMARFWMVTYHLSNYASVAVSILKYLTNKDGLKLF